MPQRREVKKIALSRPVDHDLALSTWSLSKLAELLVAEGVVDDISHEGLRVLLREEGVSFQVIKTWKQSTDPDFEAKQNRVLELYDIADGKAEPGAGGPDGDLLHGRVRAVEPGRRVGEWAAASRVELADVPTNASWLNRIEAQFQALRYFTLDGTDHRSHDEQNRMIRRYIAWRNRHAHDKELCEVVKSANVA